MTGCLYAQEGAQGADLFCVVTPKTLIVRVFWPGASFARAEGDGTHL